MRRVGSGHFSSSDAEAWTRPPPTRIGAARPLRPRCARSPSASRSSLASRAWRHPRRAAAATGRFGTRDRSTRRACWTPARVTRHDEPSPGRSTTCWSARTCDPSTRRRRQRSDTIVIVHIPAGHERAYLISIPRDLLVDIPPYPDSGYKGGKDKINAAFQYGQGRRRQLLSQTLTNLTGVQLRRRRDHRLQRLQEGRRPLGGVEMCVDSRSSSIHTGHQSCPRSVASRWTARRRSTTPGSATACRRRLRPAAPPAADPQGDREEG